MCLCFDDEFHNSPGLVAQRVCCSVRERKWLRDCTLMVLCCCLVLLFSLGVALMLRAAHGVLPSTPPHAGRRVHFAVLASMATNASY